MAKNSKKSNMEVQRSNKESNDRKVILLMGMGLNGIDAGGWALTKDMMEHLW